MAHYLKPSLVRVAFALWAFISLGCAVQPIPRGFARHTGWGEAKSRALSPDGVMYSTRFVKNKEHGDLAFWHEATKTRMTQAGYRFLGDSTLTTHNTPGVLIRLAAPLGQKDYLYWVALSLQGNQIRIVEAAGEVLLLQAREAAVLHAITE
jgi:hypothetical protein